MASKKGVRKWLRPLGQGPWLTDPSAVRVWGRISLGTFVVALGLAFVVPRFYTMMSQPGDWAGTMIGIMLLLFLITCGSFMVMLIAWWSERAVQYCPDCLGGMTRGAYVCPSCGLRETPRKEHA